MKVTDILGCSDHEKVMLKFLRGGNRETSRIRTLDFRRVDLDLFFMVGLDESHGMQPWGEDESRRAVWFSFILFFHSPAPSHSHLLPKG